MNNRDRFMALVLAILLCGCVSQSAGRVVKTISVSGPHLLVEKCELVRTNNQLRVVGCPDEGRSVAMTNWPSS